MRARSFRRVWKRASKFLQRRISGGEGRRAVDDWFHYSPEQGLLFEHEIEAGGVIVEVGGYVGEWSARAASRYPRATLHTFEPVRQFAASLRERVAALENVVVHEVGVGGSAGTLRLGVNADGTSAFAEGSSEVRIEVLAIEDALRLCGSSIELLAINAEGMEYEILESLIAAGQTGRIKNLLVQFHKVVPNAEERRGQIQAQLGQSHQKVFDFPFAWEKWVRRQPT